MKHGAEHGYDLTKATVMPQPGGYDLTKARQEPQHGRAAISLTTGARQSIGERGNDPLVGHSPPRSVSPRSKKGRATVAAAFHEVEEDEPEVVGTTRRKKGAKAAQRQKVAIALSKARQAGVRIPKKR